MKWLAVIIILLIIVGAIWLMSKRRADGEATIRPAHRLDESVMPPVTPGLRPDIPSTTAGSFYSDTGVPGSAEEPGSDFAWEPEVTDDTPPRPDTDPGDADGRTTT
jgi:hypothetical protein